MTMAKYQHVFSPIRLGPVEIPNRFYFAPHGIALTVGSKPSADYVAYNAARAKGGCGLIINALTAHHRAADFQPSAYPRDNIPSLRAMADAAHDAGAKIFGQLWYWWGVAGQWQPLSPAAPALGPSPTPYEYLGHSRSTHEMAESDIRAMLDAFRVSTTNLREAGYDGIMVHAAHGGLIEQFLSPYFNHRTDQYGGTLENRMRVLVSTLEATREAAGDSMAVGMRFNCDELTDGGFDTKGSREILARVCPTGLLDFIDLDVAVEPQQFYLGMPSVLLDRHTYQPYVEAVRSAAGDVPVLSVLGRLTSIADGDAAIASGVCDMVGAARALIAEPNLMKNAREGNETRSRTCIACNWCVGGAAAHRAQACTINPVSYRERVWSDHHLEAAPRQSKVIVVGSGPAGLEAARVSALRGHDVTLVEARDRLGGALALWADLPGRDWFFKGIQWWERELGEAGVTIDLGHAITADEVLAAHPDAVVVATGALYSRSGASSFRNAEIPGWDRDFVYRPEDVLTGVPVPSGEVVLLDCEGHHASVGMAEILSANGCHVDYLTPGFQPVSSIHMPHHDYEPMVERLKKANVTLHSTTYIRTIDAHSVVAYDVITGAEQHFAPVVAVVLCTSRLPVDDLSTSLVGRVPQVFTIGDAYAARPVATAAYEGYKFAMYIGDPAAPHTTGEAYFAANAPEVTPTPAIPLVR